MSLTAIKLDQETLAKLDEAAIDLGISRENLLTQALTAFVENLADKDGYEQWFAKKVEKSIRAADVGQLIAASEVNARSEARIAKMLSGKCD